MQRIIKLSPIAILLASLAACGPEDASTAEVESEAFRFRLPIQYDLPFKGEDFDDDEKVYRGKAIHSASGVQQYGYDLGAVHYDTSVPKWTQKDSSANTNAAWVIYNKPIYAMRAGKVIACWRNAPENPTPGSRHSKIDDGYIYGGGNGFWIEHDDGSRAEYAHMIPGTAPASLCPHNAVYMPTQIASPNVNHAWPHISVPASQQVQIARGQYLGRVGNAGTSSAPHLHVHVEKDGVSQVIRFRRGIAAPLDNADPYGVWTRFAGQQIPPGKIMVWPPRTVGSEYSRHGLRGAAYQSLFDHLGDSGFKPKWIDGYRAGGTTYFNLTWVPTSGAWRASHNLTASGYQAAVNSAFNAGLAPVHVDTHAYGSSVRYHVIFEQKNVGWYARHDLTYAQHLVEMNKAQGWGLSPVSISVASVSGTRRYAVLYHSTNVGGWVVKSQLTASGYQSEVTTQSNAGRTIAYLNTYVHGGTEYYAAVFTDLPNNQWVARHGLNAVGYQLHYGYWTGLGYKTRATAGMDGASAHKFAAVWAK